jgi:hypothetical protein
MNDLLRSITEYLDEAEKHVPTPAASPEQAAAYAATEKMIADIRELLKSTQVRIPLVIGSKVLIINGPYFGRYAMFQGTVLTPLGNLSKLLIQDADLDMEISTSPDDFYPV